MIIQSNVSERIMQKLFFTLALTAIILLSGCSLQSTKKAANNNPDLLAHYHQAIKLFRDNKPLKALKPAKMAAKKAPSHGGTQELLGLIYQRLNQYDEAEESFKKAIALIPDNPRLLTNYGNLQCQKKNYHAAIKLLTQASEQSNNKQPDIALTNAALCAQRADDTNQAKALYLQAYESNPKQAVAMFQLGQIYMAESNPLRANEWLSRYLEHNPHTAKTLYLGAQIEHQLGNTQDLEDYTQKLQNGFPGSDEASKVFSLTSRPIRTVSGSSGFSSSTSVFDINWIRERNPDFFTIHVATRSNRTELEALIRQMNEPNYAIYSNTKTSAKRFHLITGNYATFSAAQAALSLLTSQLPNQKPWIRNFGGIQAVIGIKPHSSN